MEPSGGFAASGENTSAGGSAAGGMTTPQTRSSQLISVSSVPPIERSQSQARAEGNVALGTSRPDPDLGVVFPFKICGQ